MKVTKELLFTLALLLVSLPLHSRHEGSESGGPFRFGASYTGDFAANLKGGLRRGSCYLGLATIDAGLDTEAARLWKNGYISVKAANTHGATPSSDLFGDAQVSSNIEAGNHTFLMELWIRQRFGNVELTAGLQDLNAEFAMSDNGGLYLNSSFGIMPVISGNIPAPLFPLTSPGITAVWKISAESSLAIALFDGRPTSFDYNPYNTNWQIKSGDGILAVAEFRQKIRINNLPGEYKFGLFTHNHFIERKINEKFPDSLHSAIHGGYLIADQTLWHPGYHAVSAFIQAGYSPSPDSFTGFSLGLGINVSGIFSREGDDTAGLALTHGWFRGDRGGETAIEFTYRTLLTENVFVQPDLQYIIHPSGKQNLTPHCLAGFLRMGISF